MNKIEAFIFSYLEADYIDYLDKPSEFGFQAKLYYFYSGYFCEEVHNWAGLELESFSSDGIEVQVMTHEMKKEADKTHALHDEKKYQKSH